MRLILLLLLVFPSLSAVAAESPEPGTPSRTVVVRTHRGALRHVGARATPYVVPVPERGEEARAQPARRIGSLRALRLRR